VVAHTRVPRSSLVQQAFEKGVLKSVSSNARRINKRGHPSFLRVSGGSSVAAVLCASNSGVVMGKTWAQFATSHD
jgi:hypothetical protein